MESGGVGRGRDRFHKKDNFHGRETERDRKEGIRKQHTEKEARPYSWKFAKPN